MICSSSNDGSPPRKKLCRITGSHPTEDLSKICSIQWEADKLEVINKELDSLDDTDFFLNPEVKASLRLAHSRRENGFSVGSEHSEFALSTLFARTNDDRIKFGVYFKRQLEPKAQPTVGHTDPDVPPSETHSKPVNFYPEIAQDAKREATVLQQVAELKQQGMWSASRLPKVLEPREKPTWQDCFFSEMLWLSADFIEERKWKKKMALDLANAARNYLRLRQEWNRRCEVAVEVLRKRNAAYVASMVGEWWRNARKELRALSLSATGKHRRHLLNQNTALLATASDLCPSWMAKVHYNTSSQNRLKRSHQPKDDKFISVGDGETDDSDWAPASCTETSGSDESRSRSTSSSRAVSFIGDTDGDYDGCYLDSQESDIRVPLLSPTRPLIEELNSWKTDEHILHIPSVLYSADPDPQDEYLCQLEAKLEAEQQYCKSNQSTPHNEENSFSSVPYSPRFHSSDSTDYTSTDKNILLTQNPDESIADEKHADPCPSEIQTEVDLLNSEALLPLESVLPDDYLSIRDKQLRITTSEPHQFLQSSVFSGQDTCLTAMDSSSANDNVSFTVPPDGGVLFSLSDTTTTFNRPAAHLTVPPWGPNLSSNLSKSSLVEIQSNALRLFSLLKTLLTDLNTTADVCAAANLPTFRLSTLPLYSIAVVVSWLRHALPLQVPALLLPSNPMSGDAELAVAAHLGQLVIPVGCNPIHSDPETSTVLDPGFGDWGPHLIVTPRLYLPVWRSRLSHWCPGFKVTCLGLGSRTSKTPHEPSGSTRRLRSAVAHGSVNVCLTTYAAVLARPSRYSHIRWSVIILDQVSSSVLCSYFPHPHRAFDTSVFNV
ncbi:unnamed protein product [Dicrocoelium dendriticum]|nr:unnamed protein product [Dicrocoelium dendriticum]